MVLANYRLIIKLTLFFYSLSACSDPVSSRLQDFTVQNTTILHS